MDAEPVIDAYSREKLDAGSPINNLPMQHAGIKQYKPRLLSHCNISDLKTKDLRHTVMEYVSAKKGIFEGVDFSYTLINECYFHGATFVNCSFIGARIYRSNFRGATFENCKFDYIDINETRIASDQVIKCLPDFPNIAREICQVMRRNATSLGDTRSSRLYVIRELEERKHHLRRAIRGQGPYYKEKYSGFIKKLKLYGEISLLNLDSFSWGHGEKIWKMILPISIILLSSSLLQTMHSLGENDDATTAEIWQIFTKALTYYTSFFLSVEVETISPKPTFPK